jgi:hypothetical protein
MDKVETAVLNVSKDSLGKVKNQIRRDHTVRKLRYDVKRGKLFISFSSPSSFNPADYSPVRRHRKQPKRPKRPECQETNESIEEDELNQAVRRDEEWEMNRPDPFYMTSCLWGYESD